MSTWIWIVIGVAAAAALVLILFGTVVVGRRRLVERRRAQAHVFRQEAEDRNRRADERESLANDLAAQAREERERAKKLAEKAGKLDPTPADKVRVNEAAEKRRSRIYGSDRSQGAPNALRSASRICARNRP